MSLTSLLGLDVVCSLLVGSMDGEGWSLQAEEEVSQSPAELGGRVGFHSYSEHETWGQATLSKKDVRDSCLLKAYEDSDYPFGKT